MGPQIMHIDQSFRLQILPVLHPPVEKTISPFPFNLNEIWCPPPLNALSTIVLCWCEGFQEGPQWGLRLCNMHIDQSFRLRKTYILTRLAILVTGTEGYKGTQLRGLPHVP